RQQSARSVELMLGSQFLPALKKPVHLNLKEDRTMYLSPRSVLFFLIFWAMVLIAPSGNTHVSGTAQSVSALQAPSSTGADAQAEKPKVPANAQIPDEDAEEGELEPAAVAIDVTGTSPLIQALYQATRLTKENEILEKLDAAQKLLDAGADVKAVDAQGRNALHWAVFGSSYSTKTKTLVKYEEIADALIAKGVEINREDAYQDTALDYLLYSPTFEMQTLLIEHGASSGFLAAFYHFFRDQANAQCQDSARQLQAKQGRSEEHTSELQSLTNLVCRLLLEKKKHSHKLHRTRAAGISTDFRWDRRSRR